MTDDRQIESYFFNLSDIKGIRNAFCTSDI